MSNTTTQPDALETLLTDILPHVRVLMGEGHALTPDIIPAAFDRWMAHNYYLVEDHSTTYGSDERKAKRDAAVAYIARRLWTEVRAEQ